MTDTSIVPAVEPPQDPSNQTVQAASLLAKRILEPLCEGTKALLEPIEIDSRDMLSIDLDGDTDYFIANVWAKGTVEGERLASSYAARWFFDRFPEKKKLGSYGNEFQLAATDITALIIDNVWPAAQLDISADARLVYDKLILTFMHQTLASEQRAQFKINGILPELPEGFIDHPTMPLSPYQLVAAITSLGQEGSGMFMKPGTGKTPLSINRIMNEAAEKRKQEGGKSLYKVLVVCPKNVRMNWQNEIQRFATLPGKVTVLRGTQLDRLKLLTEVMDESEDCLYSVSIITYESVNSTFDFGLGMVDWDLCILDEGHEIKSVYAKIHKVAWKLRDTSRARMILTGTPITNSVLDLFTQLEFLGKGFSGFIKWQAFKNFYAQYEKNEWTGFSEFKKYQNLPFLQERLARLCYTVTKQEALPFLPLQSYDIGEVTMTPRQAGLYKDLQKRLAVEIDAKLEASGGMRTITANCVLTMLLRLSQITSGFIAWDENVSPEGELLQPKKVEHLDPNPKLDQLVADIKELEPNSKFIVWACWVPSIMAISARLVKEGIVHGVYYGKTKDKDRAALERDFNCDPKCKGFVGNPAAGGVGLNLWGYDPDSVGTADDHGMNADHVFYFDQSWSMTAREQSENRNHRRGTRVPVHYRTYIVPGSIDREIHDRLQAKITDAANIQDVRAIMHRVLDVLNVEGV